GTVDLDRDGWKFFDVELIAEVTVAHPDSGFQAGSVEVDAGTHIGVSGFPDLEPACDFVGVSAEGAHGGICIKPHRARDRIQLETAVPCCCPDREDEKREQADS